MYISRKKCAIVIPFYSMDFRDYEFHSLHNCVNVFKDRDIFLLCPETLDISSMDGFIRRYNLQICRMKDSHFKSIESYNKLCLSVDLYKLFNKYEFMLIHQLDAYVFKDDLDKFCDMPYDYIGAPLCHLCKTRCRPSISGNSCVGNGGLSLRRISKFISVLNNINLDDVKENEDVYIFKLNDIRRPSCDIARQFSVQVFGFEFILKLGITPMGYHKLMAINSRMIPILHYIMDIRMAKQNIFK